MIYRHNASKTIKYTTLWHQTEGGMVRRVLIFLLKRHRLEGVLIVSGSMLNKQYGDPNTSKLLQLVVSIV